MSEPSKSKGGRPRKPIDPQRVERVAANFWTVPEIAADLGCHERTLERRFAAVIEKGRHRAKASLRSMQFQVAMGQAAQPAVFLREYQDADGNQVGKLVLDKDGNPIKIRDPQPRVLPNVTMLIWLGKQHLGQADKVDFSDDDADGFGFAEPPTKEGSDGRQRRKVPTGEGRGPEGGAAAQGDGAGAHQGPGDGG